MWSITLWAQSYPASGCGFGDLRHTASTATKGWESQPKRPNPIWIRSSRSRNQKSYQGAMDLLLYTLTRCCLTATESRIL